MASAQTHETLVGMLAGFLVYAAAYASSVPVSTVGASAAAREGIMAPLIFAYTALAFWATGGDIGNDPNSLWQQSLKFIHTNIWLVLMIASGFFAASVVATMAGKKWCKHALKKPCTAIGMMAQEICPDAQGPGFVGCVQEEAVAATKAATTDLNYAMDLTTASFAGIGDAIQAGRMMFAQIRDGIENAISDMTRRVVGAMTPAVRSALGLKALIGQLEGVLTTMAFLVLSGIMTVKSFIGGSIQAGDTAVAALAITAAILFATFEFVPAAIALGITIAVAIPLALISDLARDLGISW